MEPDILNLIYINECAVYIEENNRNLFSLSVLVLRIYSRGTSVEFLVSKIYESYLLSWIKEEVTLRNNQFNWGCKRSLNPALPLADMGNDP